jgi:LysR family hydrogen peroxide-inducible transcriptional activator
MNNITLKQLRYFEALSRHRHFGHAADACAISQPAMSLQIKELEISLGLPLFERNNRQVNLTRFGEEFSRRVRTILRHVDDLSDLARDHLGGLIGPLRIGIIPTIAPYLLPTLIDDLSRSHPQTELHIRETLTEKLIEELTAGKLDAAIVALPVSEPALTEKPLFAENFILVRKKGDADTPVPDAEDLRTMRLLLLEEGHCFRDQALSFCNLRAALPRETLDGSSLSTLVQMVGAGIGVTLIPEMAVAVETRSAAVSVSRFKGAQPSRTIGLIWRKTSPLADQLSELSEIVRVSALKLRAAHA